MLLRCFNIKFLKQYCCYFAPFPVSVLTLRFYLLFRCFFFFLYSPFFLISFLFFVASKEKQTTTMQLCPTFSNRKYKQCKWVHVWWLVCGKEIYCIYICVRVYIYSVKWEKKSIFIFFHFVLLLFAFLFFLFFITSCDNYYIDDDHDDEAVICQDVKLYIFTVIAIVDFLTVMSNRCDELLLDVKLYPMIFIHFIQSGFKSQTRHLQQSRNMTNYSCGDPLPPTSYCSNILSQ